MATNHVSASYAEVYDLATSKNCPTIVGIHTPTSLRPQAYLKGFYDQYRYVRYKGCKLTMVPAATLPVDPLGVSYEAGEPTIDPRDMLNPMLHFGCSGDDLGAVLDDIMRYYGVGYDGSSLQFGTPKTTTDPWLQSLENLYYQMLTAQGVGKTGLQEGLRKSLYPLVSQVMANTHLGPSNNPSYAGTNPDSEVGWRNGLGAADFDIDGLDDNPAAAPNGDLFAAVNEVVGVKDNVQTKVYATPQLFTQGKKRLGWMPTITAFSGVGQGQNNVFSTELSRQQQGGQLPTVSHRYTALPKVFMYAILMPKALKTRFYYRAVLRHYFEFKDFHSSLGAFNLSISTQMRQWDPIINHYGSEATKAMKAFNETDPKDASFESPIEDVEIRPLTDAVA